MICFQNKSILVKIGLIISIIILLCIISAGSLFVKFEIKMAKEMAQQYSQKMKRIVQNKEKSEKEFLNKVMKSNLDVLKAASGEMLFQYNMDDIVILINSVLNINDIVAVSIHDHEDLPIYAGWKAPQKIVENELPKVIVQNKQLICISQTHYVNNDKIGIIALYYSEKNIERSIKDLKQKYQEEMDTYNMSFNKQLKKMIIIQSFCIGLIIVFIILSLVYSIQKIVLKPVKEIEAVNYRLSNFDFTIRINDNRNDELGKLLKSISLMIHQFKSLVGDVKNIANSSALTSKKIVRVSRRLTQNFKGTSIASEKVTIASNNMSLGIQTILEKVKHTNENSSLLSETSEQIAENIQQLSDALDCIKLSMKSASENANKGSSISEKAVEMAEHARSSIQSLEKASNEIDDVIRVIMKISDKTNLLALNASIEAAAAGEAGKGFAVVANAIQKFADQSALAADHIASQIKNLQHHTMNTIQAIIGITEIIQSTNDSISNIKSNIYKQYEASDQILANALEAREKSEHMAHKLAELSEAFDQTTQEIDYLSREADQVSCSIQAVSNQTNDSNNEINQLNDITRQIDVLSEDLYQQVEIFKL